MRWFVTLSQNMALGHKTVMTWARQARWGPHLTKQFPSLKDMELKHKYIRDIDNRAVITDNSKSNCIHFAKAGDKCQKKGAYRNMNRHTDSVRSSLLLSNTCEIQCART